jgi:AraC-like DNA-binding protein
MHPLGGFGLVFNLGHRLQMDQKILTDPVFFDGVNTRSRKMGFEGHIDLLGVRFHVGGAFPFVGIPLGHLQNETQILDAVPPRPLLTLHDRLFEADTLEERISILENWLLQRLSGESVRDRIVPASLSWIQQSQGQISMAQLEQTFPMSLRQLERLYQSQVGMPPKMYARLLRINMARLALKRASHQSATEIGLTAGFYDQSHFIREFSAVVGMTPLKYRQHSRTHQSS